MTTQREQNRFLDEKLQTQIKETEEIRSRFMSEFQNLATKIFKDNSKEFIDLSKQRMDEIIAPLREKMGGFEKLVSDTYEKGLKDQTDLKAELRKLSELNYKISEEAHNLTRALKGDVKKQGNWGEIILERIFERSGLVKGQEYVMQASGTNNDEKRIIPDAIIYLPGNRNLLVDSKVSLIAYEKYVNEEDEELRKKFAREHLGSVKNHIKLLSDKQYQTSSDFVTPDFVLMFIPIESGFSLAVQTDQELFGYAWENKIVIVSPSTLLATLLTIASVWRQEHRARNVMEIAKQSAAMYDKFVGFLDDMEKIGKNLGTLQNTYQEAFGKLSTGKGNIITRIESIRKLGLTTNKSIDQKFHSAEDIPFNDHETGLPA